ncbi:phosphoribosylglycinamide formyltransferase [Alcanivorax quisquiliarum]|uniref:Phosphoribosylglycinamide formyltransferase n=1 Tax=Alcanivorax quisquiliarum TaxID=2933565 RepID=A0ABT0E6W0_9GAMM|nr:phosphoribosylglycinamide formyltransferase [Alcanivorax quisquiliarum]MCK0537568.1 phosphoribosylglycinamide formyltransferase [Alcanivorax quisquiliarum]
MIAPPSGQPRLHRLAILISGSGTNLQAIIAARDAGVLPVEIALVASNRPTAGGLQRAAAAGIATAVVDHREFATREDFDQALIQQIDRHQPDTVVLAGFMRILTAPFVRHYAGRLLNIHPSLLPRYPGLDTHRRALEAGDSEHGCSIHFVTDELDGGPLIARARVPVSANDTALSLSERVQQAEHWLYPRVLGWRASGRLRLDREGVSLDGQIVPATGICVAAGDDDGLPELG